MTSSKKLKLAARESMLWPMSSGKELLLSQRDLGISLSANSSFRSYTLADDKAVVFTKLY